MKKWMMLVFMALMALVVSCSDNNSEATMDSDDKITQTAGSEMSSALEEVVSTDEVGALSYLDQSLKLPFEAPDYLVLSKINAGTFSSIAEIPTFDFAKNCGTYKWDFVNKKWNKESDMPSDSIIVFFPARRLDSLISQNSAKFIWSKCEPAVLDSVNLPTKIVINVKFPNNPNKELKFNWEATYRTLSVGNWSRIFPETVNGLISFGNDNHGDLKIALVGNSEINNSNPENSKINFNWLVTKGSSVRLSANLDITFVPVANIVRPVYELRFDKNGKNEKNKNTEIFLKYQSDKVYKLSPTVADIDSALSGSIMHNGKMVANLEIKDLEMSLPASNFIFRNNAYFVFNNGKEIRSAYILYKITHHRHPFGRFFRYLFHHNEHFTPEITG